MLWVMLVSYLVNDTWSLPSLSRSKGFGLVVGSRATERKIVFNAERHREKDRELDRAAMKPLDRWECWRWRVLGMFPV